MHKDWYFRVKSYPRGIFLTIDGARNESDTLLVQDSL